MSFVPVIAAPPGGFLPGRSDATFAVERHFVTGTSLSDVPPGTYRLLLGMGCFWGAERKFWTLSETLVHTTSVGYGGGSTPNPTYEEVCSGRTGHTELVAVTYKGGLDSLQRLLQVFWESHDPTSGMRQGNDVGSQYRSAIYCESASQLAVARASAEAYQQVLTAAGLGNVTTELGVGAPYYFAEPYHQQYLAKNPNGYCGLGGTGVAYPC